MPATRHEPFDLRYTQNFLKSRRLVERLLDRSGIGPEDVVLEIGPGRGRVTACLAGRCRRVIAVELDGALAARLRRTFAGQPRVAVHHGDALTFPLPDGPYKVFASIPFHVTTAIVTRLTGAPNPPQDAYLVMQREAAERFCGVPAGSLYSVLLKPWFEPQVVHRFARADFDPAPNVDVVMLRLRQREPPLVAPSQAQRYRDFVVHCFGGGPVARRLRLGPLGRRGARRLLARLGIDAHAGPAALRFEQWLELFRRTEEAAGPDGWRAVAGAERRLRRLQAGLQRPRRAPSGARRHAGGPPRR
ncbi:MAG TPA: 23S ribosomal RNA methyltransferase Erm [Dehalococcoidia bacterium]